MSKLWTMSAAIAFLFGAALFTTPALAGKGQSHASSNQSQTNTNQSTASKSAKKTKPVDWDLKITKKLDKASPK